MQLQQRFRVFHFHYFKKHYLACKFSMRFHSFVQKYTLESSIVLRAPFARDDRLQKEPGPEPGPEPEPEPTQSS